MFYLLYANISVGVLIKISLEENMKKKTIIALFSVIVFLVQAACALGATATQAPAPTQDVNSLVGTNVALTQAAQPIVVIPTNTTAPLILPPSPTTGLVILPTNTTAPLGLVTGLVNYGANCRSGPGANFPNVVVLVEGSKLDIIGKANATDGVPWWQVRSLGQPDCWLIDMALAITGDKGSVPVVVSPPTPTPAPPPSWTGTWTYWMRGGFGGATDENGKMALTQTGNSVTSNVFSAFEGAFVLNGTISDEGMTLRGNVSITRFGYTYSLPVVFKRNPSNLNQFRGSWYNSGSGGMSWDGDWCGATNGAGKPSPCKSS